MRKYLKKHPFAKIGILAIPMLIFTVLMDIFFPKTNPDGFQSFIIAFEFAKTPGQIHQLFNGFTGETFSDINTGNYIDFGFMVTYTLFLVLFFKKAAKTFNKKWLLTGIPLSVIVLFADVMENVYLLQITQMYTPALADSDLIPVLNKLHIVTWVKWGGLAVIFALFSVRSMGRKIVSHIEGIVFIIPFLFGFWALSNDPIGISRFTLSIALAFFLLLFYCFWYKAKNIEKMKKSLTVS
jgi:hypothetical protein